MRIGFGYDVHPLVEGRPFCIGGIVIPFNKGPLGHSDGDALIHALCDALLGAAAMGDIGIHFPDNSEKYKNIDSKIILGKTYDLIKDKYIINNIDITVCLQKPKISNYISEMRKVLADILNIKIDDISIKATTTEKLGFVGREEGIAVYAVVLINELNTFYDN